jgi:plasmid maintenance system antidote protein VapI
MAMQLSKAFGSSPEVWLGSDYRASTWNRIRNPVLFTVGIDAEHYKALQY